MSTIITGAIVIAGTIGIIVLLMFINKRNIQNKKRAMLDAFNEKGASEGISFSSQEILTDKVIGLDRQHQRLLILDQLDTQSVTSIRICDVNQCRLTKEYQQVNFGNEKKADFEKTLRSIAIQFSFKNNPQLFVLTFYDSMVHSIYEMSELEEKAKKWEALLSRLLLKDTSAAA